MNILAKIIGKKMCPKMMRQILTTNLNMEVCVCENRAEISEWRSEVGNRAGYSETLRRN